MRVFVVGDRFLDIAFQAVHGEVHRGQADGGGVLFQAVESELLGGVLVPPLDHPSALHEHATRAAGRVQHRAAGRFDDVGDQRDQRHRGEELAAVVGLLVGKLGQEVFVDAAKDIPGNPLELLGVESAQQVAEHRIIEFLILALGQHAAQVLVVRLDGLHGVDDRLSAVDAVGQGH